MFPTIGTPRGNNLTHRFTLRSSTQRRIRRLIDVFLAKITTTNPLHRTPLSHVAVNRETFTLVPIAFTVIRTKFRFSLTLTTIPLTIPLLLKGALLTWKVTYTNVMILIAFPPAKTTLASMGYYIFTGAALQSKGLARICIFWCERLFIVVFVPH